MTPNKWLKQLATLVPGTSEYSEEERQYLQKMRNVTAKRVEQFSDVFAALSKSFMVNEQKKRIDDTLETDYLLSNVTEKVCQNCFMKKRCWQNEFDETYSLLDKVKVSLVDTEGPTNSLLRSLKKHCMKHDQLLDVMTDEVMILKMNKQ